LSLDVAVEALEHSGLLPSNPVDLEVIDLPVVDRAPALVYSAPVGHRELFQKAWQASENRQPEGNKSNDR
jgi:hypothetical protein